VGQPVNFGFMPLHDVGHETYTVYFPITKTKNAIIPISNKPDILGSEEKN